MKRTALVAATALLITSCVWEREVWTAFVYPPGQSMAAEDAQRAIYGTFSTFEECQVAAIDSLRQHLARMSDEETDELGMGGYECGVGCRYEREYGLYMCKETRK